MPRSQGFEDARWFPIDLDATGVFRLSLLDPGVFANATFHDIRLDIGHGIADSIPFQDVPELPRTAAWLWHTSFCGSSLLSRMLQVPLKLFALREPWILRRLSDHAHAGGDIAPWTRPALGLLSRPWETGGQVVIKPTHGALNISLRLMEAAPEARAILLTSDLQDFLISHLKKTPETLQRIPVLAERALAAGSFVRRLPAESLNPPSLLAAAGLQWAAQRELACDLLDHTQGRCMPIDYKVLLEDPAECALRCADWLNLDIDRGMLRRHATAVSQMHAKAPTRAYDAGMRNAETQLLAGHYQEDLEAASRWYERWVHPFMRSRARDLGACHDIES